MGYKVEFENKHQDELDTVLNEAREEVLQDNMTRYIMQAEPGKYYYSTEKDEELCIANVMHVKIGELGSDMAVPVIDMGRKWELEEIQKNTR